MEPGYNQVQGTYLGQTMPIAKEQSISELSHMVSNQADIVANHIASLLQRIEGGPGPQGPPQPGRPEGSLASLNKNSFDVLCKVDSMISLLERKLFG